MTTFWEYDTVDTDMNVHQLDEMGADGWELVGFTATPLGIRERAQGLHRERDVISLGVQAPQARR